MSLAKKLQVKEQHRVLVVDGPSELDLGDVPRAQADDAEGLLVFVTTAAALREREAAIVRSAKADRLTWVAYPKGGQRGTDLNRDILWKLLDGKGIKPVRQVSLDDVWSALRFRPA